MGRINLKVLNFFLPIITMPFLVGPANGSSVNTVPWDSRITNGGITTFTYSSGNPRAARADFQVSDNKLVVTLINTSAFDIMVPEEVLTAIFFDLRGNPILVSGDAILGSGSQVYRGSATIIVPEGDVGSEWAYRKDIATLPAAYCISSVGLGDLIGPKDRFDTSHDADYLWPPASPDGLQFGIASTGDNPSTGNGGVLANPLIRDSVMFTLSGLSQDFGLDGIFNVWFHYGTDYSPPVYNPSSAVPEPVTMLGMFLGICGLVNYLRNRRVGH